MNESFLLIWLFKYFERIVIKKIDSNRKDANREKNLKNLKHDHIAKYYDFFDYNGNPFVVTEYCNVIHESLLKVTSFR